MFKHIDIEEYLSNLEYDITCEIEPKSDSKYFTNVKLIKSKKEFNSITYSGVYNTCVTCEHSSLQPKQECFQQYGLFCLNYDNTLLAKKIKSKTLKIIIWIY